MSTMISSKVTKLRCNAGRQVNTIAFTFPHSTDLLTGSGKTELAKTLASFLFDSERALITLNMSEYMEKHVSAARMLSGCAHEVSLERVASCRVTSWYVTSVPF